jgi:hypothetical protein
MEAQTFRISSYASFSVRLCEPLASTETTVGECNDPWAETLNKLRLLATTENPAKHLEET